MTELCPPTQALPLNPDEIIYYNKRIDEENEKHADYFARMYDVINEIPYYEKLYETSRDLTLILEKKEDAKKGYYARKEKNQISIIKNFMEEVSDYEDRVNGIFGDLLSYNYKLTNYKGINEWFNAYWTMTNILGDCINSKRDKEAECEEQKKIMEKIVMDEIEEMRKKRIEEIEKENEEIVEEEEEEEEEDEEERIQLDFNSLSNDIENIEIELKDYGMKWCNIKREEHGVLSLYTEYKETLNKLQYTGWSGERKRGFSKDGQRELIKGIWSLGKKGRDYLQYLSDFPYIMEQLSSSFPDKFLDGESMNTRDKIQYWIDYFIEVKRCLEFKLMDINKKYEKHSEKEKKLNKELELKYEIRQRFLDEGIRREKKVKKLVSKTSNVAMNRLKNKIFKIDNIKDQIELNYDNKNYLESLKLINNFRDKKHEYIELYGKQALINFEKGYVNTETYITSFTVLLDMYVEELSLDYEDREYKKDIKYDWIINEPLKNFPSSSKELKEYQQRK